MSYPPPLLNPKPKRRLDPVWWVMASVLIAATLLVIALAVIG